MANDIICSIGGSVIFPDTGVNTSFLKEFNKFVRKKIASNNRRFFIIVGGGHTGREYQYTAERVVGNTIKNEDLNWLGVHATRLNAHLLRSIFNDIALPNVIVRYDKLPRLNGAKVVVGAGWLPGTSTDFDQINLARILKITDTYSLLNVKGVYDRDPKLFKDAKLVKKMRWPEYRELIGDWWSPKRQLPFDPFASKLAENYSIKVNFIKGDDLVNFDKAIKGHDFVGTVIE